MDSSALRAITLITARERLRIAAARGGAMDHSADKQAALVDVAGVRIRVVTTADLISMKERD